MDKTVIEMQYGQKSYGMHISRTMQSATCFGSLPQHQDSLQGAAFERLFLRVLELYHHAYFLFCKIHLQKCVSKFGLTRQVAALHTGTGPGLAAYKGVSWHWK